MTLAEKARRAVRARPFVHEGLRAGVINYSAAARLLDVGDEETVAAALRRYAAELPEPELTDRAAQVTMESGFGRVSDGDGVLAVGDAVYAPGEGSMTAVLISGAVDASLLTRSLARLEAEEIEVEAAGVAGDSLVTMLKRRDAPRAVQYLEEMV